MFVILFLLKLLALPCAFVAGSGRTPQETQEAQAHHKHLYGLPNSTNDGDGFPPITLRFLAWFIFQGKKKIRGLVFFLPLRNIPSYP